MDKQYLYTVDYTSSRGKYKNKNTTLYYYNAQLFAWLKDPQKRMTNHLTEDIGK